MPSTPLRWGLLSTARIHERLIPAIRATPRGTIMAVASRDVARAGRFARQWSIPRSYGTYEELLADREIDVLYNPLPNSLHCEWSVKAAASGKHVLCEKPLACTVQEVDRMRAAAARHGVVIQEAAMMRFHPQTAKLRDLVAAKSIGDVRCVRGVRCPTGRAAGIMATLNGDGSSHSPGARRRRTTPATTARGRRRRRAFRHCRLPKLAECRP
jgi:D-xylose 1-dehydrogenase (NADP+, D-xylono-1,5-lactone-forming)